MFGIYFYCPHAVTILSFETATPQDIALSKEYVADCSHVCLLPLCSHSLLLFSCSLFPQPVASARDAGCSAITERFEL